MRRRGFRIVTTIGLAGLMLVVVGAIGARWWYNQNLKPFSQQSRSVLVVIPVGYTTNQIAQLLQNDHIIRSATAFEWYVRNSDSRSSLQAGQYKLDPTESVSKIVSTLVAGRILQHLFTILPGQRIDQIEAAFIKAGYLKSDVIRAFNPDNYTNPVLKYKPASASLEGYLYPNSFETNSATTVGYIINQSLNQMNQALTPAIINGFQKQGLNVNQAITLASIVVQEVSNPTDQRMVAGVFLNRLKVNMPLGSDVTYHYAAIITNQPISPTINSPYNTRLYAGLPPGPISNVTASALYAVANPIVSNYLYFVTGDNGKTYYSTTEAEHEAQAAQYCKILCSNY